MTDEPDYKKMYDELKTQFDSINSKFDELNKSISERDSKITKLQCYIADNIVNPVKGKPNDDMPKSFDELYKEELNKMSKKEV